MKRHQFISNEGERVDIIGDGSTFAMNVLANRLGLLGFHFVRKNRPAAKRRKHRPTVAQKGH